MPLIKHIIQVKHAKTAFDFPTDISDTGAESLLPFKARMDILNERVTVLNVRHSW